MKPVRNGSDGPHRAVAVELDRHHVAAGLDGLVPRAMAGDEDRAAVIRRKHRAGVETHAEHRHVRPRLATGGVELGARGASRTPGRARRPGGNRARRNAAGTGPPVELVLRGCPRPSVAAIVGEAELGMDRFQSKPTGSSLPPPPPPGRCRRDRCGGSGRGVVGRAHVVARHADADIEPVVRADADNWEPWASSSAGRRRSPPAPADRRAGLRPRRSWRSATPRRCRACRSCRRGRSADAGRRRLTFTSARPSWLHHGIDLVAGRVPTNTVPLSPTRSDRASATPAA